LRVQQWRGPPAGLPELFSARGFNGLRGRLDLITLVATPVILPCERSLGVLMRSQRLDLTDNERAIFDHGAAPARRFRPQSRSPQTHALKAILERLEPQKPQPIPDTASTG
jgi:hypothetical protein